MNNSQKTVSVLSYNSFVFNAQQAKNFFNALTVTVNGSFVMENVDYIKKYYPSASILNSWDFGLPQRRIRAFVSNFTTFRMNYSPGKWTKPYQYSGARADNKSRACAKHITRSGTVRTKRIRDLETGEYLPIQDVKILMGFPGEYILSGSTTNQQKQLGNAVCPPISKAIAEGIMNDIND